MPREGNAEERRRGRVGTGEGVWSPPRPRAEIAGAEARCKRPRLWTGLRERARWGARAPVRPPTSQDPSAAVRPVPGPYGSRGLRSGLSSGCRRVLLACGRAPIRALWPGPCGDACMGAAWVGPLNWTQRAGGTPSPHSPQAADRSGGGLRLPDRTWSRGGSHCPSGPPGDRRARLRPGRGVLSAWRQRGVNRCECVHIRPWWAGRSVPAPLEIGRMSPVGRG